MKDKNDDLPLQWPTPRASVGMSMPMEAVEATLINKGYKSRLEERVCLELYPELKDKIKKKPTSKSEEN